MLGKIVLDKIVIVNNYTAYIIFTDRKPITLSSDSDVRTLVLWFIGDKRAQVNYDNVLELRRDTTDEITTKIILEEAS